MNVMTIIPGTNIAVTDDCQIWSLRWNRVRKPDKHDIFPYYDLDGRRHTATRAKLVWTARHGVEPWKVPREFSFHIEDGKPVCETFGDRMARVRSQPWARASWQDYDFIEQFARACKEHMMGDRTAERRIFLMLHSKRQQLIDHARCTEGGVGKKKAIDLADQAIQAVFEETVSGARAVPSPVASMKSRIGWYIKRARMEKRQLLNYK